MVRERARQLEGYPSSSKHLPHGGNQPRRLAWERPAAPCTGYGCRNQNMGRCISGATVCSGKMRMIARQRAKREEKSQRRARLGFLPGDRQGEKGQSRQHRLECEGDTRSSRQTGSWSEGREESTRDWDGQKDGDGKRGRDGRRRRRRKRKGDEDGGERERRNTAAQVTERLIDMIRSVLLHLPLVPFRHCSHYCACCFPLLSLVFIVYLLACPSLFRPALQSALDSAYRIHMDKSLRQFPHSPPNSFQPQTPAATGLHLTLTGRGYERRPVFQPCSLISCRSHQQGPVEERQSRVFISAHDICRHRQPYKRAIIALLSS
jgi:hypothetical protein